MKRKNMNRLVTIWDVPSNTFTKIPKSELAPGMVSCRLPDRKEEVWRDATSILTVKSPYRHPPFEGEMRSKIESVVETFIGFNKWSYEKWENLLRKDTNPHNEICYWLIAAHVFRQFGDGKAMAYRKELYQFLSVCNTTPRDCLPMVFEKKILSADEVEKIADAYYSRFAG